jgi:LDH2 family malate/lactate/ureidoglycolate dehydrogenase
MSLVDHDRPEVLVDPHGLEAFVRELFHRAGMDDDGAAWTAHALVETNLLGIDSHGCLRVRKYIDRLRSGAINGQPHMRILVGQGALEIMDGDNGAGFVVGRSAMLRAIWLAQMHSVGVVGVVRSNHFGAAGLYARLAAASGLIGVAMTNVTPNVVAPGGSRPVVGNNPLAIAAPTYGDFPFVIDVSFSAVAGGKLLLAQAKGERIPLDWATDREGRPTGDPQEAFAGFLLAMGGFKGLGLAYAVDILCGVVTGGAFGRDLKGMYTHPDEPSETGHMMIALNVDAIMDRDRMQERMTRFTDMVKASPMREGCGEMLLPGEVEYRCSVRRANGIPLPVAVYDDLARLGQELGTELMLQ